MKQSFIAALLAAAACGGGAAPIDGGVRLIELSAPQITDACADFEAAYPAQVVMCSEDDDEVLGFEPGTCEDQLEDLLGMLRDDCPVLFDEFELCTEALYQRTPEEACGPLFPAACDALVACRLTDG